MKILFVTTISPTIGFVISHIEMLINKGYQVDVAFNNTHPLKKEFLRLNCKVHNINFQRSPLNKGNFQAYRQLANIIEENEYDLIHTHTPIASFFTRFVCRNKKNIKIIYTAHGFHFTKTAPKKNWLLYYPLEKLASKWTDAIITMNEEDYLRAKNNFACENVFKVHGVGLNLTKFSPPANIEEKIYLKQKYGYTQNYILFYAAELNQNKNQLLLIEVIKVLKDFIPNIKLLLAGTGSMQAFYEEKIQEYNLKSNVDFLGFRTDVPHLLKMADICVASSKREGLPVNLMEGMATGIPIVATKVRGHIDLIQDNRNGYTIELTNPNKFAEAILKLYNSKSLREQIQKNNIEDIKQYKVENVLVEMESIYDIFLNRN